MTANRNVVSITVAVLALVKLALQAFGIQLTDADINTAANAVAALVALYGVVATHIKRPKDGVELTTQGPQPPPVQ